ncbi:uracil-DNA glycosylase family protein [Acetobacter pomorum]|uniref:Uracil-DNA glycosylase family protein n=1 Tax=Acetobacter pomorum TaxID=65959 RepID=A0A2G4REB1_9PROT|nr:uracil-DNA glycosylase [Acetobacter pomorum]PHY94902.1 uracil-DNA glycosylase family protein [Acetobacter pomorum]
MMDAALSLLRLYTEWGVDVAVTDTPADHRHAGAGLVLPPLHGKTAPKTLPKQPETGRTPQPAAPILPSQQPAPASFADIVEQAQHLAAAASTPEALFEAMDSFTACPLRGAAMHTLMPSGPQHAPLMLIGEAPDEDEERSGHVFAGMCGAMLDAMLAPLPLERSQLALATALPWRPAGGTMPTDMDQRICRPFLERAITLFAPRRVLLCGRLPARMLLGKTTDLPRRTWQDITLPGLPPLPVMVMRHPLQLRASAAARRDIWNTLMTVMDTLRQDSTSM